jgi:probable HAF family extracellular repeat protein
MKTTLSIEVLALLALAGVLGAQSYPYVLTDLGTLPGNGTPIAWGINEAGDTTVGSFSWPTLGWVRTAAGMAPVGTLPGCAFSTARDVNDSGQVVGSSWVATINQPGHAYRLTPGVGMVDLGTLGGISSEAWRINDAGQVIGDAGGSDGNNHAFLYSDGTGMVSLAPQAAISYGRGISHDGKATGSMTVGNSWRAFRYIPGVGLSDIGVPPGFANIYGYAINDLGQVAGTISIAGSSNSMLFRWTPGSGFVVFGSSASTTSAWAINASGTVVGRSPVGGVYRAVMYADGLGMVDLNTLISPATGWALLYASDINDAGQIVGYGMVLATGETRPFRLDPSPMASIVDVGPGCAAGPAPTLSSTLPHLGQALTLSIGQAPGLHAGALVVSNLPAAPFALGGGCVAYVDVGAFATLASLTTDALGAWQLTIAIPSSPTLLGAQFALQAVIFPTAGPFGVDLTNGLFATIGY